MVHSREDGGCPRLLVQPDQAVVELQERRPGCLGQLIERSRRCLGARMGGLAARCLVCPAFSVLRQVGLQQLGQVILQLSQQLRVPGQEHLQRVGGSGE